MGQYQLYLVIVSTEAAQKVDCPFVGAQASDDNYIFAKTKDAFDLECFSKDISVASNALKAAFC